MGSREGKEQIVSELTEQFKSAQAVVVVDYRGISVAQDTKLRKELRENGVKYVVAKNTLLSIAAKEAGFEGICDTFKGVTSVAFCDSDAVAPARIIGKFSKDNKILTVKGGILEGEVIDAAKVQALSELPSKEILLAPGCVLLPSTYPKIVLCIRRNSQEKRRRSYCIRLHS